MKCYSLKKTAGFFFGGGLYRRNSLLAEKNPIVNIHGEDVVDRSLYYTSAFNNAQGEKSYHFFFSKKALG